MWDGFDIRVEVAVSIPEPGRESACVRVTEIAGTREGRVAAAVDEEPFAGVEFRVDERDLDRSMSAVRPRDS